MGIVNPGRHKSHRKKSQHSKDRRIARDEIANLDPKEVSGWGLKFIPRRRRFHSENALFLAVLAAAAYHTGEDETTDDEPGFIEAINIPNTSLDIFPLNNKGTEGFVMTTDDAIIISFCGTNQITDWLRNLDFALVEKEGAYVHRGFWVALDKVWDFIFEAVKKARNAMPEKPIWLCGHSLGGALAVVAAFRFLKKGIPIDGVYTFGQPLVSEGDFASELNGFDDFIYRFVNKGDPIPLVPITTTKPLRRKKRIRTGGSAKWRRTEPATFGSVGKFYWFKDETCFSELRSPPTEDDNFFSGLLDLISDAIKRAIRLEHHDIKLYARRLHRCRNQVSVNVNEE